MEDSPVWILGSKSPRRKQLASVLGVPFVVMDSDFDETKLSLDLAPELYTLELAKGKALSIASRAIHLPILTADTVVYADKILNKAETPEQAREMLSFLRQKKHHKVYTSLVLYHRGQIYSHTESTEITLRDFSDEQMDKYIELVCPFDYAGAYSAQGVGYLFIQEMKGCYTNVIGLPLFAATELLQKANIDAWQSLSARSF